MTLIDKETIRAEIKRLYEIDYPCDTNEQEVGFHNALDRIEDFLDTLQEQPVIDHHEIEVEFRGEKVTVNREFCRDGDKNYSTNEQDDNVIWAALRAWCEKKGVTAFELYPKQPEQPASEGLEDEIVNYYGNIPDDGDKVEAARHFYELGQQSRPKISDNSLELEQEILSYIRGMGFGYGGWVDGLEDEDLCKLARHFAEWGAEHLKK